MIRKRTIIISKLDTENPIIRINTVFNDYSSTKKVTILPRIYHDWMSLDMIAKEQGRLHKKRVSPFSHNYNATSLWVETLT